MARLIGDIGGTNARFALVDADGLPSDIRILQVADHPGLVEAAQAYLGDRVVDEAVIAVATPVEGDAIRFTNAPWSFSVRAAQGRLPPPPPPLLHHLLAPPAAPPPSPSSTTSSPRRWPSRTCFLRSASRSAPASRCPTGRSA